MISTNKLRKAMREIAAAKGEFNIRNSSVSISNTRSDTNIWLERLLGQAKSEEVGQFLDQTPTNKIVHHRFRFSFELLTKSIGRQSLRHLARIVTLNPRDPSLKAVVSAYAVDDGEVRVQQFIG